jgi:tetratricopeptide (TPR) repeat protein
MRNMNILIIGICALLGGCNTGPPQKEARQLAEKRFSHQKAKIKYLLAFEQFRNGQIDKARESASEAIGLHADDPAYFLLLTKIYLEAGELSKAREVLSRMADGATSTAEYSYLWGLVAERYGRLDQASEFYREAHELAPRKTDYLMAYGETLISLDDPEQVLYLIEDNIQVTENHARLWALEGEALNMLGRFEEAARAYRRALVEFREDRSLLESYAMALFRAQRYAEALTPLANLHTELEDQTPLHALEALARCCLETEAYARSATYLWEVTRRDPGDAEAWRMLTQCSLAVDNLSDAKLAAERAVALSPDQPGAHTTLGFVLVQLREWVEARRVLAAAYQANPDDVVALCLLGQVLEAAGSSRRAAQYYKRALQADPDDVLAKHFFARLRSRTGSKS